MKTWKSQNKCRKKHSKLGKRKAEIINRDITQTKNQALGFSNIKRTKKLIMFRHSNQNTLIASA